jgi:SSS family solute:Na+ symporter
MSENKKLFVMRIFIAFFVAISAIIAIIKDSYPGFTFIAQMMGVSWGALAGAFLAPFMYGLYWKKTTKAAVWTCFAFGIFVTIVQLMHSFGVIAFNNEVLKYLFASSIRSGVVSMIGGIILLPIVSLYTPQMQENVLDEMFNCYEKKVLVPVKETLEEE